MINQVTYASFTDRGSREVNEDSIGIVDEGRRKCFVLCDGLGGHGMGDIASSLAVDVFKYQFTTIKAPKAFLEQSFLAAQDIILAEQNAKHTQSKMKTTAVAAVISGDNLYVAHVGDSRAYIFHKNKVKARTLDHSIPQMLVLSKTIKDQEIRNHPDRSRLLRVLGVEWETPQYDIMPPVPLRKCQAVLLCSDGFWELIEESNMCEILERAPNVNAWLSEMLKIVKENGRTKDMDNYSAIAVWCN